jgi:hypothetical protein
MSMVATLNVRVCMCESESLEYTVPHLSIPRFHARELEFPSGIMLKLNVDLDSWVIDPRVRRPMSLRGALLL